MHGPSNDPPVGMVLWHTASAVSRAFDEALGSAGGSRSVWSVLLALKTEPGASQRELAETVGIQGATLTHHLSAMEADGLLTRRRDPDNRRVHQIELTDRGEYVFLCLRDAAVAFDQKLRSGIPETDIAQLRETLSKLQTNAEWRR